MNNEEVEKMMLKKSWYSENSKFSEEEGVKKKEKENLLDSSIVDLFISEALSCLCYQSFCYEKLRLMLEAMTVDRINWNTEMGCLKVQLLKQHYQKDQVPKKKR